MGPGPHAHDLISVVSFLRPGVQIEPPGVRASAVDLGGTVQSTAAAEKETAELG